MPDDSAPEIEAILTAGAELHERFVADSVAMDKAWRDGTYDEWLDEQRRQAVTDLA